MLDWLDLILMLEAVPTKSCRSHRPYVVAATFFGAEPLAQQYAFRRLVGFTTLKSANMM